MCTVVHCYGTVNIVYIDWGGCMCVCACVRGAVDTPTPLLLTLKCRIVMSVGRPVEGGSVSTELLYSHTRIHNIYIPCTATDTPLTLLPLPPCPAPFTVYIGAFPETGRPSVGSVLAPSQSLVWFLRRLCVVARICLDLEGSQSLPNFGLCNNTIVDKIWIKKSLQLLQNSGVQYVQSCQNSCSESSQLPNQIIFVAKIHIQKVHGCC